MGRFQRISSYQNFKKICRGNCHVKSECCCSFIKLFSFQYLSIEQTFEKEKGSEGTFAPNVTSPHSSGGLNRPSFHLILRNFLPHRELHHWPSECRKNLNIRPAYIFIYEDGINLFVNLSCFCRLSGVENENSGKSS